MSLQLLRRPQPLPRFRDEENGIHAQWRIKGFFYRKARFPKWSLKGEARVKWCVETESCQAKSTPCKTNVTLSLNCPRLPDPAYAYNDTFARNYIYPLIGGLFGETPVACLK
ncbi:hypothetical protein GCK32_018202 [Trichostrongylus colubriformis]|uniref:Uncharacterized protein n=1 Tax=Trichostrongylus colubriformis TaxID=6319 RepID=A0AAN8F6S5_TRICO